MAPQPKTYGARRSRAKLAGGLVNGITVDDSESILRKIDIMSMKTRNHTRKELVIAPKGEKQDDVVLPISRKEDESASGEPERGHATPSRTLNAEDKSTTTSPVKRSLQRKKKTSARHILPLDISLKESGPHHEEIKSSINGPAIPETQDCIKTVLQSDLVGCTSLLHPKATVPPNGFTAKHQQPSLMPDIGLKDTPSNLNKLAIWVTHLISKDQNKSHLSIMPEPRQKESSPQPGQDIEMSDALENVDVRMTRGREKKILQQMKGKASVNAVDLSNKIATGEGKASRSKDTALVETMLRESLNDELKQRLFGPVSATDMSTSVIERNAWGKLLFDTIVDLDDSANTNSALLLKSALKDRKDNAPFLSALEILASSSEVMVFIHYLYSKNDPPPWRTNDANTHPSTGLETSGSTTNTETSGSTSRTVTSLTESEGFKGTNMDKPIDNKHPGTMSEKQKQSQEVTQAFDAATMILFQIQQGETGAGYVTPYASGSMGSNPAVQRDPNSHNMSYGPPHPNNFTYGMAYGPPVGANFTNYASPYAPPPAMHPNSYASPYSNPVNQSPSNYASPYANPMVATQVTEPLPVSSAKNQANKHDGHETYHENKQVHTSHRSVSGAEAKKGNDGAASHYVDSQGGEATNPSNQADEQGMRDAGDDTSQAYDQATCQSVSNGKDVASNVVDFDEVNVKNVQEQDGGGEDGEICIDNDLTDDELHAEKPNDLKITPPAKDHRLFTGERLGDFTSQEKIDWLLIMSNGGKIPRPSKNKRKGPPSPIPTSPTDTMVQMEVYKIINEIMHYKNWRGHPLATSRQLFYASAEGQRLAKELRRLMAIAKPIINTIISSAESRARLRFYQQLESRAIKEKRDCEIQRGMTRFYGAGVPTQPWIPPPNLLPPIQFPVTTPMPINGPMNLPFVRRGNVIAAPPGGRNFEEEKKAETYGYPPTPGSRPGGSEEGQIRKRARRH